jgi:hypothetical protein
MGSHGKYLPPIPWGGISADVIWGKKYEKGKRKKGKNVKVKGKRGRKGRMGKKKSNWEVKG